MNEGQLKTKPEGSLRSASARGRGRNEILHHQAAEIFGWPCKGVPQHLQQTLTKVVRSGGKLGEEAARACENWEERPCRSIGSKAARAMYI